MPAILVSPSEPATVNLLVLTLKLPATPNVLSRVVAPVTSNVPAISILSVNLEPSTESLAILALLTTLLSIVQVLPEFDTVISPLSLSLKLPELVNVPYSFILNLSWFKESFKSSAVIEDPAWNVFIGVSTAVILWAVTTPAKGAPALPLRSLVCKEPWILLEINVIVFAVWLIVYWPATAPVFSVTSVLAVPPVGSINTLISEVLKKSNSLIVNTFVEPLLVNVCSIAIVI